MEKCGAMELDGEEEKPFIFLPTSFFSLHIFMHSHKVDSRLGRSTWVHEIECNAQNQIVEYIIVARSGNEGSRCVSYGSKMLVLGSIHLYIHLISFLV
ncbi:hypothetical protein YC2023_068045 [Brassica napus]